MSYMSLCSICSNKRYHCDEHEFEHSKCPNFKTNLSDEELDLYIAKMKDQTIQHSPYN